MKVEIYKYAIILPDNSGKGCAIRQGLTYALGEVIVFIDGDREISAQNIVIFFDKFEGRDQPDVVIGSKFCSGANSHTSWKRKVFSMVYRIMNRILFGLSIRDTQMGIKAMRRDVRVRLLPYLHINGYAFDIEFLIHAARHGFKIDEVPVDIKIDPTQSRITHLSIVEMIHDTFSVYHAFFRRDLGQLFRLQNVRLRAISLRHFAVLPLAFIGSAVSRIVIIVISLIIVCVTLITKKKTSGVDRCSNS